MKKSIVFILFLISSISFAQDLLTKKNGEDISAQVLEVDITEIKYKKFDDLNGPVFTILKSEVLLIRYENGTKDIFVDEEKTGTNLLINDNPFAQGQSDALQYYKEYKAASTGTLITSLFSPFLGLVPAIVTSSTPPKEINLDYPNKTFLGNPEYVNGYTTKAKKIKQDKVWTNYAIGSGTWLVVATLLIVVFTSGF
jgi:hypothetical protein